MTAHPSRHWWKARPQAERRFAGWTPAMIEDLRRLWAEGRSALDCATALSDVASARVVTRTAVIGKIARLGLTRNEAAVRSGRVATARAARPERRVQRDEAAHARRQARAEESPRRAGQPRGPAERPAPAASGATAAERRFERGGVFAPGAAAAPVALIAAGPEACRWPCGEPGEDFRFCGGPRETGRVYCAAHAALAYQPRAAAPSRGRRR